jgi:hypothetical protein
MPELRRTTRLGAVLSALVAVALVAGCSSSSDAASSFPVDAGESTPTSSSRPPTMPAAVEQEDAPVDASFPASLGDDSGAARTGVATDPAGQMKVTGLRLTPHNGYDRLVIDLSTQGVPDWTAQYSQASGTVGGTAAVAGDAFLRVSLFTEADADIETGSLSASGSAVVAEARSTGFSAGYEEVLIGVRGGAAPFRAFTLTDPGRIVVDIRAAG